VKATDEQSSSHSSNALAIREITYSLSPPGEVNPHWKGYSTSEIQQIRYCHQPTKLLQQLEHARAAGQSIPWHTSAQTENSASSTGPQQKGCSAVWIWSHWVIPKISLPQTEIRPQHADPWNLYQSRQVV